MTTPILHKKNPKKSEGRKSSFKLFLPFSALLFSFPQQANIEGNNDFIIYSPEFIYSTATNKENMEIIGNAIKVSYEPSELGSERIISNMKIPQPSEIGSLTYDIRLCENFQFVRGGKLPGLGSEHPITGGKKRHPNEWSTRLMFGASGQIILYKYTQESEHEYGESLQTKFKLKKGVYQRIKISIILNTKNLPGTILVNINGEKITEEKDVFFRSEYNNSSKISTLLFQTFHGGHDPSWSPKKHGLQKAPCAKFKNLTYSHTI